MRHKSAKKHFNRSPAHKKAMLKALSVALIKHTMIKTTLPKAKYFRQFIEPLITRAKIDNDANRKIVFALLRDKDACKKLFEQIAPFYKDRPGGYTRILKCGFRAGDNAPMAFVQLVDFKDAPKTEEALPSKNKTTEVKKEKTAKKTEAKKSTKEKKSEK